MYTMHWEDSVITQRFKCNKIHNALGKSIEFIVYKKELILNHINQFIILVRHLNK